MLNSGVYGAFETPVTFHKAGLSHAAMYDAASVYHPNGAAAPLRLAGVPRRPAAEATAENANAAALVAFHRVTAALFPPAGGEASGAVLRFLGVDPDDASTDVATPVGVGNAAAAAALASMAGDGMNALGAPPYADYAYAPSNSPYALTNLTRWQPLLESDEKGYFVCQSHIAPQAGVAARWLTDAPALAVEAAGSAMAAGGKRAADTVARAPPPYGADFDAAAYRAQAQAVLDASANLTDEQKMAAEWWCVFLVLKFCACACVCVCVSPPCASARAPEPPASADCPSLPAKPSLPQGEQVHELRDALARDRRRTRRDRARPHRLGAAHKLPRRRDQRGVAREGASRTDAHFIFIDLRIQTAPCFFVCLFPPC